MHKLETLEEYMLSVKEDFQNPFVDNERNEKMNKEPELVYNDGGFLKKKTDTHSISNIEYTRKPGSGYIVKTKYPIGKGDIVEICPVIILSSSAKSIEKLDKILFEIDVEKDQYALVLGYGSIYKHSDTPNVDYAYNAKKKKMYFVARRTIQTDEELTINYGIDHLYNGENFYTIANNSIENNTDVQQFPQQTDESKPVDNVNRGKVNIQPGGADNIPSSKHIINDPQSRYNPVHTGRAIKGLGQQ